MNRLSPQGLKTLAITVLAAGLVSQLKADAASTQPWEIKRAGSQTSNLAPAENFTGTANITSLFQANDVSRLSGGSVSFEPGARTAWHTHPLGQTLIVTAGVGRTQRWGGPIEVIQPGDVVRIPPGVKHWHGAAPDSAMTHLAFYTGWPNAVTAVGVAREVFEKPPSPNP